MSEHYFTQSPQSESVERSFRLEFMGQSFVFTYDNGVFSKGRLDEGTEILLSSIDEAHGDILDLGCGWGAVGTILGKLNPSLNITMSDINERAVELSLKNLRQNGVRNAEAVCSDGFENISGRFDAIITNPPIRAGKQLIYALFDEALSRLKPGGSLYIVIRRKQGAESALKYLEKANAEVIQKKKGYWVIRCGGIK